jgi:diguanylate cyclase (GGDEF)-like protein
MSRGHAICVAAARASFDLRCVDVDGARLRVLPVTDDTTQTAPAPDGPPDGESSSAYLIVIGGSQVGEMFQIRKRATVVGRGEGVDVQLGDDGVSRRHALVQLEAGNVSIRDLGSCNGTLRNGVRVTGSEVLTDGDKISLGGTTILKFTYQDELDERFARRLYESAVNDGLTGLHNRRFFDERLRAELMFATRHRSPLALLLLDIDHFKRVNDELGHQVGDFVLRETAARMRSALRGEDILSRYGGEEFAVLCRNTDAAQAVALAERVRAVVAEAIELPEGAPLRVTASVGIAIAPGPGLSDDDGLVRAADVALYEAKRKGRDRSAVFGR